MLILFELAERVFLIDLLTKMRKVIRWDAHVVYGDTDSLFVHLPGRSRAEAFQIGAEMAIGINASNPNPVTLKMEKVNELL